MASDCNNSETLDHGEGYCRTDSDAARIRSPLEDDDLTAFEAEAEDLTVFEPETVDVVAVQSSEGVCCGSMIVD